MKEYKLSIIATFFLTLVSVVAAITFDCYSVSFPRDFSLSILGSSLLALISSIIGYSVKRRDTFEEFYHETNRILNFVNKYNGHWDRKEKVDFCLRFHDLNLSRWDLLFGSFSFLFDCNGKTRKMIYVEIYSKIAALDSIITNDVFYYRCYLDKEISDSIIDKKIDEVEKLLFVTEEQDGIKTTYNKLVHEVRSVLCTQYYDAMYPFMDKFERISKGN